MDEEAEVSLSIRNEEDDLSPECLAWADSCINNSPDDSENWGTFRDALTEIIDIHPEIFVPVPSSSTVTTTTRRSVVSPDAEMTETEESIVTRNLELEADLSNSSSNEEVNEIVSLLTFESNPSKNSLQDHYFLDSNETGEPVNNPTTDLGENGSTSNGEAVEEEEEVPELFLSQAFKDDFMSGVPIEDNVVDNVSEEDLSVTVVTPQEIFKVWDLEVEDDDDKEEEDGLVLQLKKALEESSKVQPLPLRLNDDVEKSSIDDLIAGISDLSLTETF